MLKIERTVPGVYSAKQGDTILAHCRYQCMGNTVHVVGVSVIDACEVTILDALLRAALLLGGEGRENGEIAPEAIAPEHREPLVALGWTVGAVFPLSSLSGKCEETANR